MTTSQEGIDLIKKFEGCRLVAYKATKLERYYTIGYGHYGKDVKKNQIISKRTAERLLYEDLKQIEKIVNKYSDIYAWSQNEFDALVSFTFNCGEGNLKKLLQNGKRTKGQIAECILLYNKAGGKKLEGLVKRRNAEKELFTKFYDIPALETDFIKNLWGSSIYLVFNAEYYGNAYSDLEIFHGNEDALLSHFVLFGMDEGRIASNDFNVRMYKRFNSDLSKVFGEDWKLYYLHFASHGHAENRRRR